MRKVIPILFLLVVSISSAQENLSYFLPDDVTYNAQIPGPDQYFQQPLGEWHLTHDQVLNYMNEIARVSDRAILYEYARSYENRPLVHLVFTSSENHGKLDQLRELHLQFANGETNTAMDGVPLVVSLNYGVHGNESSATNSSVLTAYYLAAVEGEKIDSLLGNTIIIVDPCLNPESRGRVAKSHEWKPNVVTPSGIKYSEPVRFDNQPYISGWISNENLERIKGAPVVSIHSVGKGNVISYHEDMNFRGIWMGTHKLFANSIFFGEVIR